jgi:uncharacterized membrane protein
MYHKSFWAGVRNNFFAGLAIVLPAVVSVALLAWLFGNISNITDKLLFFLPTEKTHDKNGAVIWYWSGLALFIAVLLVCAVGRLTRNFIGEKLIELADRLMLQIPLLNKIYGTVKQVNDAFSSNKSSFKGVALVPFPHSGALSMGFITSEQKSPKTGELLIGVFVPTTPNPTAGFLMFVPESDVTRIDMSVADGIKFIISLGAISPDQQKSQLEQMKS